MVATETVGAETGKDWGGLKLSCNTICCTEVFEIGSKDDGGGGKLPSISVTLLLSFSLLESTSADWSDLSKWW